ncbi:amidohydrolase [candidate division WOR-3 bacterium]|nr:amidohydrolase [candidate division WOR-3 bacterium]
MIIINAHIFHAGDGSTFGKNDKRDALFIENGKIKKIGYAHEFRGDKFLDLNGNFLLPGFIDCHVHFLETGLGTQEMNLSNALSISDILSIIFEKGVNPPEAERGQGVIIATNFAPYKLKEKRYPEKEELNKLSLKIPICVIREDFHSGVFNTGALKLLRIKSKTGILRGKDFEKAQKRMKKLIPKEEMISTYIKASEIAIQNGVTTLNGFFSNFREYEAFLEIRDKLQVTVIPFIQTLNMEKVKKLGLPRIGGCLLIDGSVGSETAAFFEDYENNTCLPTGQEGNKGRLYFNDQALRDFIYKASSSGLQIAMHAIGDRAVNQLVRAYCYTPLSSDGRTNGRTNRHRIEHCELIRDEDFKVIRKKRIIISAQPSFEAYFNELYEQKLGKQRAFQMNPFRKIIDSGIHLTFGSDSPITPLAPLKGIQSALKHPNPDSRITGEEVIKCFTSEGAYANFLEDKIGYIKEGYIADLVGVSKDFKKVNLVIKGGKVCYKSL